MSFSEIKFCGLTVRTFKSSIGMGRNQLSSLSIELVRDIEAGDIPSPPPLGYPCYFDFFGYSFYGLLQKFGAKNDTSGYPTYEATLVDPREILEGAELIVSDYIGPVGLVPNVINAYGWWENLVGFGASGSTSETGMSWTKIITAINNTANNPHGTAYGSPLNFRGIKYGLDLSGMPSVPSYYKLGSGSNICLLDAITQVCEDCGCDFYIFLDGFNIKIKTISRVIQPPLGTISALVNASTGNTLLRSEDAVEVRNETTSSFLIGGSATTLFQNTIDGASTFWGYDSFSNPIFGYPDLFNVKYNGKVTYSVPTEFMNLNARGVEDIIGTDTYTCSILEMLFAKFSHDSWAFFIKSQRPDVSKLIISPFSGLQNAFVPGKKIIKNDIVNDDPLHAKQWSVAQVNSTFMLNDNRLYEFVKNYADEYLGKKFVVRIPYVLYKQDAETLKISYSQEITDAGWQPEGSQPLGISPINEDVFKSQDGRFTPFVRFFVNPILSPVDLAQISPADSVIELENQSLFLKCNVDPRVILLPDGTPYALVTLPSAVYQQAVDSVGGIPLIAALLGVDGGPNAQLTAAQQIFLKSFSPIRLFPSPVYPDAFGIPLKSNTVTYGPWYVIGASGKTRVEQDSGLTPWGYGSEEAMNQAALSRVGSTVTNMQLSECGSMDIAGFPSASLGDVLKVDGPNLTNVSINYTNSGITTSYRFETFTPRFYHVLSRGTADRIRKAGVASQQLRRSLRQSLRSTAAADGGFTQRQPQAGFLSNASKIARRESPHDTFVSYSSQDEDGLTRVLMSSASIEEAVSMANADSDEEYQNTSIMSFNGVFRPYSINQNPTISGMLIPHFQTPSGEFDQAINVNTYNPLSSQNDIEFYSWGDTYLGLNQRERVADYYNARGTALKGPLVVNGFGYDININPVPSNGAGGFVDAVGWRSDLWKVGPVDLLWDDNLGIWTCHGTMMGKAKADIPITSSGMFTIEKNVGGGLSTVDFPATNCSPFIIPSGTRTLLHYNYKAGDWIAVMPGGSGGGSAPSTTQERLLRGVTNGSLPPNGAGTVNLSDSPFGAKTVFNQYSVEVPAGKSVLIGYFDRANNWYVISADCSVSIG